MLGEIVKSEENWKTGEWGWGTLSVVKLILHIQDFLGGHGEVTDGGY